MTRWLEPFPRRDGDLAGGMAGEADAAFFAEHGWWVSPRVLPEDILDAASSGFARYRRGERDQPLPPTSALSDWKPEDGDTTRQNGYVSLQIAEVAALIRHPALGGSAARLLGVDGVRLFHDRFLVKPPAVPGDGTALSWHTDRAYWRTCTSTDMLTAWIPFQDTTVDMGPLMVMDGSHRWPDNDWMATSHEHDLAALRSQVSTAGRPIEEVAITIRRGQISFHHCLAVHGSAPNRSGRSRTALAVHLQSAHNRYRTVTSGSGRRLGHINDLLCRADGSGDPDYTDPAIFPRLWPVAGRVGGGGET